MCACFNPSCLHNDDRSVWASFALQLYHFLTWEPHDFYLETLKTTAKSQLIHKPNYLGLHPGFFWYLQLNSSQAFCSVVSQLLLFLADVMGEKGTRLFGEFFQLTLKLFCNLHYRNHISNSSDTAHARLFLLMGSKDTPIQLCFTLVCFLKINDWYRNHILPIYNSRLCTIFYSFFT